MTKRKDVAFTSGVIVGDPTICHSCGICELVCSLSHDGACSPSRSRIRIVRDPLAGEVKQVTCRQCTHPECYYSCPVDAIAVEAATGARVIDVTRCVGCGVCAKACPFNRRGLILTLDAETSTYVKCDLCTVAGTPPQCVAACPWGALSYITRMERET